MCVCVCMHRCVWKLMYSDKLITYFLSYNFTSLTNKDWLPFVPSHWTFVLLSHGHCVCACVRVCLSMQETECEREFMKSSRLSLPQIRPWLDPVFSHDALQTEILEILQEVAKRNRENLKMGCTKQSHSAPTQTLCFTFSLCNYLPRS